MNALINKQSVIPLYYQVKESLIQRLENLEFKPGDLIPTEKELCEYYQVSRTTIRQAISELVQANYLYIQHGIGTFASKPKINHNVQELLGFSEEMRLRGLKPEARVIRFAEIKPSSRLTKKLNLSPEDSVLEILRLRFVNGEPIGIHRTFIPPKRVPNICFQDIEDAQSLYELIENKYGVTIIDADEVLEAASANDEEAELLNIDANSPVLHIERIAFSQSGEPIEFVIMIYPAQRYQYYNHLTRRRT